MATVIEVIKSENSVDGTELSIICDGFHNSKTQNWDGICTMNVRLSDFESEGKNLFIDYYDTIFERTGY